jgi:hypothetical protein
MPIHFEEFMERMGFNNEPHKLHRKDALDTSIEAANSVDATKLEGMVYREIKGAGRDGLISDDLLIKFPNLPYSSVTARFAALERKGFIVRSGDKRKGRSGRSQMVMRDAASVEAE